MCVWYRSGPPSGEASSRDSDGLDRSAEDAESELIAEPTGPLVRMFLRSACTLRTLSGVTTPPMTGSAPDRQA